MACRPSSSEEQQAPQKHMASLAQAWQGQAALADVLFPNHECTG